MAETCPTLKHVLNADQCMENFAGLGDVVYVGLKSDLSAAMTATKNQYSAPTFKEGKGLYQLDCKTKTQGITGTSQGFRNGFELQLDFTIDAVNSDTSEAARALNNLDVFFVVPDGEKWQIMYSPIRRVEADSGSVKSDTGKQPTDDRVTSFSFKMGPVAYPNYYVNIANIDELLATGE